MMMPLSRERHSRTATLLSPQNAWKADVRQSRRVNEDYSIRSSCHLTRAMVPALRKLLRRTLPSRFTLFRTTRRFFSSLLSELPVMRRPFLFLMPSNTCYAQTSFSWLLAIPLPSATLHVQHSHLCKQEHASMGRCPPAQNSQSPYDPAASSQRPGTAAVSPCSVAPGRKSPAGPGKGLGAAGGCSRLPARTI